MTLVAESLTLKLGGAQILNGVSAAFTPGQVSAIVGPNGAGKSTLLGCLAALTVPGGGTVLLDGQPLATMPLRARAQAIGYLPQVQDVHWDVDVRTLVALGRFAHRGGFAGESDADRAAIDAAMDQMDVAHFAARSVHSLSGGERARVLIARVLAGQPRWLLTDEPLASLDIGHQIEVLDALTHAAHVGGMGVIMVLHDLSHARSRADHIVMLDAGQVAAHGPSATALSEAVIRDVYRVDAHWSGDDAAGWLLSVTGRSDAAV